MGKIISHTVLTRRERVPVLIRYFYIRALMCEFTLEVNDISAPVRERTEEEFYMRVSTLMTLDWYSATHPFSKEDVEIEPMSFTKDEIRHWWLRYKHFGPEDLVDRIWVEVDL